MVDKTLRAAIFGAAAGGLGVLLFQRLFMSTQSQSQTHSHSESEYSTADQPGRFAAQKAENSVRALNIDAIFDPSKLNNKKVLVTGTNRGIGLAIVKELVKCGAEVVATCRKSSSDLNAAGVAQIIEDIDVTSDVSMKKLVNDLDPKSPLDIIINNAGYFMAERESLLSKTLDFEEEKKMIDICSIGMLRVTAALWNADLIKTGGKVAMITSQGGSIAWRDVQCPSGGDYGHHMSKAAANMMAKLLANELKEKVAVSILHPGFNKTDMTRKYNHIWEIEGAVDASIGAKRTLHEINLMTLENTGSFINCEDGKLIPW